jgi:hypothetical protein
MKACRKKVLGIFGMLLVAALLFVPYHQTRVNIYRSSSSVIARRVTTQTDGHMFLLRFLKLRGHWVANATGEQRNMIFNKTLFIGEISAILSLGIFDYFLFCLWLGRRRAVAKKFDLH